MNSKEMIKAAKTLRALGNLRRVQIVNELLLGEKNVGVVNRAVKVSQPALSQHLAVLRDAGVLVTRRDGKQIFYRLAEDVVIGKVMELLK